LIEQTPDLELAATKNGIVSNQKYSSNIIFDETKL